MKVRNVKLTPSADPTDVEVSDVVEFLEQYPDAQVQVLDRWVPFEKKYAVML